MIWSLRSNSFRYAVALWLATVLAFFVTFVLQLEPAQWSGITVWIVFMQDPRLNYSKVIWWAFGTVTGAAMAVALTACFNQAPELGLFMLALWLSVCAGAARLVNFYRSYGLVLAGYTCAVVFMSSVDHPEGIFQVAVTRASCIFIGMASAVLLIVVMLPKHGHWRETLHHLEEHFRATLLQAARSLEPESKGPMRFAWRHLADRLSTVEHTLDRTTAETADSRAHSAAARSLVATLFDLLARAQAVEVHVSRPHATPPGSAVTALMARTRVLLTDCAGTIQAGLEKVDKFPNKGTLESIRRDIMSARQSLSERKTNLDQSISERFILDRLEEILNELGFALQDWSGLFGRWAARRPSNLVVHKDYRGAMLYGLRMFLAISLASALWFITQWPSGAQFILFIAVVCSLLSLVDYAPRLGFPFLKSALFCAIMAYAEAFWLLQRWEGFLMLALVLGIFLVPAAYAYRHPRLHGGAVVSMLVFYGLAMAANQMDYDIAAFLNNGVTLLCATACGFFVFHAVPSFGPGARAFFLLRAARKELCAIGSEPAGGLLSDQGWTSRMFDRLRLLHRTGGALEPLLEAENELLVSLQLGLRQRRLVAWLGCGALAPEESQIVSGAIQQFRELGRYPGMVTLYLRTACLRLQDALRGEEEGHQGHRNSAGLLAEMWEMTLLLETSGHLYRA